MELNRRIFQDTLMQPKTSSFSLQGIAPVGDEESWGDPAASTILAIAVFLGQVLIRVCVLLQRKLSLFLVAGQGE